LDSVFASAAEPGGEWPGDLLGPPEHQFGQQLLSGELDEAQRDQELADEHGGQIQMKAGPPEPKPKSSNIRS
jgi:hypothetical protein